MIDRAWHVELLRLSRALPARDRTGVLRFVRFQVSLANVVGALRLRFAFGMDEAAAGKLLVPGVGGQTRNAVAEAFRIAPDGAEDWRKWGFGWLLADQLDDSFRRPDPVRAESAASRRLFLRAHQLLHQYPFTLCPLVAWFTLRQREASLLQSAVERIVLNIPEAEILSLVGEG
jgi:vacuolar-type H+-ATPase subunit C/Vma6